MRHLAHLLVCLGMAFCIGCATTSSQEKAEAPNPHAGILFATKCVKCHDISRVEEAHKTKTKLEMQEILKQMKEKPGSDISEGELNQLLQLY